MANRSFPGLDAFKKLTKTAPIPCRKWRLAGAFGTLAALVQGQWGPHAREKC
jgi:hypothetical protein